MDFEFNGKKISNMKIGEVLDAVSSGVNNLNKNVAMQLERRLRKYTQDRLRKIKSAGVVSYAAEAYFSDFKEKGKLPALSQKSDKLQTTQHKIALYRNFLSAKTSTVKGAKEVIAKEEQRVWGTTNFFNNRDERERFWSAYMEYMNQHEEKVSESLRVQNYLAHLSFWRDREFKADDLTKLDNRLNSNDILGKLKKKNDDEENDDDD